MAFATIEPEQSNNFLNNVRLIATDMDGTLTQQGKFRANLLQAFEDLKTAGIPVLIVTGRSAGWVNGLANYLPVAGAIAENGGLFYQAEGSLPVALTPISDLGRHRQELSQVYQHLKTEFPQIQESTDNRFRLTDWTFENHQLNLSQLERLQTMCATMGWGFTYSSVQCHIKPVSQDKAVGLLKVLDDYFPQYAPEQVMTIGDSPNDASLFNREVFPLSIGVANVLNYADELPHQPAYVTQAAEGEGFCELVKYLRSRFMIDSL
ncbi:MAG: HAD family phosphatase [Symploca sp. SIO1C4]|uniref:HAD family phosphatase n=1 Tax=Symploca sp. SIO1C4 TaxID=2607765 RepID=A0A6B3NDQ4_9CYAN|nr:HAD family phosphatase [Symploca sp. SIO1C4]